VKKIETHLLLETLLIGIGTIALYITFIIDAQNKLIMPLYFICAFTGLALGYICDERKKIKKEKEWNGKIYRQKK